MDKEIKVIQDWKDSLFMCPSQCILKFEFEENIMHFIFDGDTMTLGLHH